MHSGIASRYRVSLFQEGSSLLEVVISLSIFAISLLGLLSLQGVSVRLSEQASTSSNAAIFANDLFARIHSNRAGLESGGYSQSAFDAIDNTVDKVCLEGSCSPVELANYDLWLWKNRLDTVFSDGTEVELSFLGGSNEQVTINFIWLVPVKTDENDDGVEDLTHSNCAKGENRPANELSFCATMNITRM